MALFAMALILVMPVPNVEMISESTIFSWIMEGECYFRSRLKWTVEERRESLNNLTPGEKSHFPAFDNHTVHFLHFLNKGSTSLECPSVRACVCE